MYLNRACLVEINKLNEPSVLTNKTHFSEVHLSNEFNFWNVHGIMNTSGLLQSNVKSLASR